MAQVDMKIMIFISTVFLISNIVHGQFTLKRNEILSRKKRFLRFPEGSNFVVTASAIKNILLQVPPGFITIIELDVFFKLPTQSDKKKIKKYFYHYRQRREIYKGIAQLVDNNGFDGDACVKRMLCEIRNITGPGENSLFQQILFTVFSHPSMSNSADKFCRENLNNGCTFSLLDMILNYMYT